MVNINKVINTATERINTAVDNVTYNLRSILINEGGIPEEIANKYHATYAHGGEWLLDDDNELSLEDIQLMNNDYIIETVRELENL